MNKSNKKNLPGLLAIIFYMHGCATHSKLSLELDYSDNARKDVGTIEFKEYNVSGGTMNLSFGGVIFHGNYLLTPNDNENWEYIYYYRLNKQVSDQSSLERGKLSISTGYGCSSLSRGKEYHYTATFNKNNRERLQCAFIGDAPNEMSSGKGVCLDANNIPTRITFGKFYLREKSSCKKSKIAWEQKSKIMVDPGNIVFKPDKDNNKIRDDIDDYINLTSSMDEEVKIFAADYAELYQEFLTNYDNFEKNIPIYKTIRLMNVCLYIGRPYIKPDPIGEIESQLISNRKMFHAHVLAKNGQSEMRKPIPKDELYFLCDKYFPAMSNLHRKKRAKKTKPKI